MHKTYKYIYLHQYLEMIQISHFMSFITLCKNKKKSNNSIKKKLKNYL